MQNVHISSVTKCYAIEPQNNIIASFPFKTFFIIKSNVEHGCTPMYKGLYIH